MSDAYETSLDAILAALVAVIKTTTSFAVYTYTDYIKEVPVGANPVCFVRVRTDRFSDIGPQLTWHLINFDIQITHGSGYGSSALNSIISYVGEVVDAIEADRTLSTSYVENTEVESINYDHKQTESAVFHYADIKVVVEAIRG